MTALTLERLLFDPSNLADGPVVGSYLLAADGTVFTATEVDGKKALDVNVANAIAVDIDKDFDSITAWQGGAWTVSAVQSGSWSVNLTDDSIADGDLDSGNPLKIGGHAYDQATVLGAVDANDRVNLAQDLYRRVFINDAPNIGVDNQLLAVGLTAIAVPMIAGQTRLMIQNISDKKMYVGASDVTISGATQGLLVEKGTTLSIECGQAIPLYVICEAAGKSVVIFNLG
jgi:hypothetical protein